jgi:hypothetical protein
LALFRCYGTGDRSAGTAGHFWHLEGIRDFPNVRFAPETVIPKRCAFHPKRTSDERSAKSANDPVADMLNERLPPKTGRRSNVVK